VDDFERWANLEGPEPDEIRALLDAAEGPGTTAEREARMERRLQEAIAEEERRKDRNRTLWKVGTRTIAALGVAAAVVLVLRSRHADPIADRPKPTHFSRGPGTGEPSTQVEPGPPSPVPVDTSKPDAGDAGPARPPRR
jgi:hypothetical protein